jgi:hypothetical protein
LIEGDKAEKRERETRRERERKTKKMWWNSYTSILFLNAAIQEGPAGGNT